MTTSLSDGDAVTQEARPGESGEPDTGSLPSRVSTAWHGVCEAYNWFAVILSRDPRWRAAEDWRVSDAGGFLVPAKVCPRDCTHEVARRELVTRTSIWGQARVRVRFVFETETCPDCGSRLLDKCGRCKAKVLAPISGRCRACGLPQPWSVERRLSASRTRPQRWDNEARDPARPIYSTESGALLVADGDITNIGIEGIVSNDDVDGRMYTVIASSIKAVAGQDVERESIAGGPYPLGEAWYTDAGSLPPEIHGIVHVAAMDRHGNTDPDTIVRCVGSALREARRQRLSSLGIAAFGTGPRGPGPKLMDLDQWLREVGDAIMAHLDEWDKADEANEALSVLIVLYEADSFDQAVKVLNLAAEQHRARRAHTVAHQQS